MKKITFRDHKELFDYLVDHQFDSRLFFEGKPVGYTGRVVNGEYEFTAGDRCVMFDEIADSLEVEDADRN